MLSVNKCNALRKDGKPCNTPPQTGQIYCGNHMYIIDPSTRCQFKNKKGKQCKCTHKRGEVYCGQHIKQITNNL